MGTGAASPDRHLRRCRKPSPSFCGRSTRYVDLRLQRLEAANAARDDAHREGSLATTFQGRGKVKISRFKGLGEMPARNQHDNADHARAGTVPSTNARAG
jgi:hypothetical protein